MNTETKTELVGAIVDDTPIEHYGSKIRLPANPADMPIKKAIEVLERKMIDEEKEIECMEWVSAFPLDAAAAFMKAVALTYGWASPIPTPGFFGEIKPKLISMPISMTETTQVAFGRFELPGIDGYLETSISNSPQGRPEFLIVGTVQKKSAKLIKRLAELTREFIKTSSVYRGKAVVFKTKDGKVHPMMAPAFIDTSKTNLDELILNEDVKEFVETTILTPIRHTERCREASIPLNRAALLEGFYGVGKTLIAKMTAKICEENGWTFLLLDKTEDIEEALLFAQQYSPAVVFCEDIDRVTSVRDEKANDILNTIDGILTKDAEVISIMTTNHVELIDPAMLRPGRMDSVITITPPNKKSAEKLIRVYARGLLKDGEDLTEVSDRLAGLIPAVIREVVERSKLRAILRMNGTGLIINKQDLLSATSEMKAHLSLITKPTTDVNPIKMISGGISALLEDVDQFDEIKEALKDIYDIL